MSIIRSILEDPTIRVYLPFSLLVLVGAFLGGGIAYGALFARLGESAWKAWVPGWNFYLFLRLGGFSTRISMATLITMLIPGINLLFLFVFLALLILSAQRISEDMGRASVWWPVLFFLNPIIWAGILGFTGEDQLVDPLNVRHQVLRAL